MDVTRLQWCEIGLAEQAANDPSGAIVTAWEQFMEEHGDVAARANELHDAILSLDFARDEGQFQGQGMSDEAASIAAERDTAPNGLYGAGVWILGTNIVPALFVQPGL